MPKPVIDLTATEIVFAIESGRLDCQTVARETLSRIEARETQVQAWAYLDPQQVMAQARMLDGTASTLRRPLLGVPFGVKDIIDSGDMPTEYASAIYAGHRPRNDAACIALSRRAGALLMGKTVTTEFANRHPGKTRNPHDLERTPGGSSSGSAAAVADHMVPLAIGTQTTGSTIKPASFCGVFGYKPTHDHLRCAGLKESAHSLDTLGLFARSIEDFVLWRAILVGERYEPLAATLPAAPRIGFCRTEKWPVLENGTREAFEQGVDTLARAGAIIEAFKLPEQFEQQVWDAHQTVSSYEFARNYAWEIDHHWDRLSDTLRNGRLRKGIDCPFESYVAAQALLRQARVELDAVFERYDLLLTVPVMGEAPLGLAATGDSSLCAIWTALHVPALTVPVFGGPHGLPIGAQLIGQRDQDRKLLSFARWVYRYLS